MLFDIRPKDSEKDFFDREEELNKVKNLLGSGRWVAVLGPRMMGKTSLIKVALSDLDAKRIYVDLRGTRTLNDLLRALIRGLRETKGVWDQLKELLGRIEEVPGGLKLRSREEAFTDLYDLFSRLSEYEEMIIALDEVQEVIGVSKDFLDLLAHVHNSYKSIKFVFTGSVIGVLRSLLEPSRSTSPLYGRPPAKVELLPFERDTAMQFLLEGFREIGMEVGREIEDVLEKLGGVPGWLTLYGNKRALEGLSHRDALESTLREAEKIVMEELRHFLSTKKRKELYLTVLRASLNGASWGDIRSALVREFGRVNPKTIQSTIESLRRSYFLTKENGEYRLTDPIMRRVVSKKFSY